MNGLQAPRRLVTFFPTARGDEVSRGDCGFDAEVGGGTDGDAVASKVGWGLGREVGPDPPLPAPSSAAVDAGPHSRSLAG